MDLLTHIISGAAIGGAVGHLSKKKNAVLKFSAIGALAGMLPDVDAISLWSKFDRTFGTWLGLEHSGEVIYSEKFWYSHHGFTHSLLAPIVLLVLFFGVRFLYFQVRKKQSPSISLGYLAFLFGYWTHLFEDLPTPDGPWGGIRLLFPSTTYYGGTGHIWWWNNYDIFLLALLLLVINNLLALSFFKKKNWSIKLSVTSTVLVTTVALFQITHRPFDFDYNGDGVNYKELENKSLEIQKEILGPQLYQIMKNLDQRLPLYF